MATYISGVTDYIPDFQPFQPDYNFYNNVLQTKQNQYDKNYKQLNNLYGQLYYQDVTRDSSNKMKDDYLKNIDYELKRVSGLDLSLEQNVEQAKQIFRPVYENKNLMKDMALTKNYKDERSRAIALASSKNKDDRGAYWDVGIKDMDYRLEEFKNAAEADVLSFGNIMYTPNVNATQQYLDFAKKYNLSVDITQPDETGMYMVRQKNGDLIVPTLQKMFYADYINDPALQKKYSTEAYVKRKDEAKARATKYGNNEVLAEKEYLKEQFLFLKDYTKEKEKQAEAAVTTSTNQKNNVEQDISNGDVNPFQPAYLQKIQQAIEVDEIVYKHSRDLAQEIDPNGNSYSGTTNITSVDGLDLDNLELARFNVDRMHASYLAEKDIISAADAYSKNDMIYKREISPLGLETVRHQNAMARDQENNRRADLRAAAKIQSASDDALNKWKLDNGFAEIDPQSGKIVDVVADPQQLEKGDGGDGGLTENKTTNLYKYNRKVLLEHADELSSEYVDVWINTIKNGLSSGSIHKNDLPYLLGQNNEWGLKMWDNIKNKYDSDPETRKQLVRDLTVNSKIFDYKKRMDAWALKHNALSEGLGYNENAPVSGYKLDLMKTFYTAHLELKKQNDNKIANVLSSKLEANGIKDKGLRYTIIDQYLKKYVTGKAWEDDEFNDMLDNIFDSYEKRTGKDARPPGFFEKMGRNIMQGKFVVYGNVKESEIPRGGISESKYDEDILSILNTNYDNITKNPDHKIGLLSYLPTIKSSTTGKTSLAAIPTSVPVNLSRKDDNLIYFNQFLEDLRNTNFNQADKNSYMVSLKGNKFDPEAEVNVDLNNTLKNMLFDLSTMQKNKNQKGNPTIFKLIQSQIGAENSDLGAMTIKNIPEEVIKKYFDPEKDGEVIKDIKTNGITYIAPTSNWKNSLFQSNRTTPTEALLNAGKVMEYIDPTYGHKITFERDNVTGNYRYSTTIRYVDDDGIYHEGVAANGQQQFGKNIDQELRNQMDIITSANERLKQDFKKFHSYNNEKAVKTFQDKFGRAPKNAGFKFK